LRLEHEFEVAASPDQTFELLLDAERVVPCMPGATLLEVVDERTWKSELGIKLGPVAMQFLADVKLLERDDAARAVKLGVSARDTRGKGGAEATVVSALHPTDSGGTRVAMTTDLRFSGQAAQLGRPGVVKDVSNKLVGQFAECIKGRLSTAPEERAAAVEQAHKPVSGLSLAIAALVGAVKRLFGIGREKGETT
jgi:carbon monoxide dehydrogenase subunit G